MTATLEKTDTDTAPVEAPTKTKRGKRTADTPSVPSGLACAVSQSLLKGALSRVTRALGGRTTLPILGNVRLIAGDDALELACTDLSLAISTRIAAEVQTPGSYTVPARLLSDFVATLPLQPVTLRREGEVLHVQCGRAKGQIKGAEVDEFPALPAEKIDREADTEIDAATLTKALKLVSFAALSDVTTGVLTCVHVQADGLGALVAEAADGHQLAIYRGALESESRPFDVIVPVRDVQEIERLTVDGTFKVWLLPSPENANHLVLRTENTTLSARLQEGQYPDLERVTPKDNPVTITAPRVPLLAAINQALLFSESIDKKDQKGIYLPVRLTPAFDGAGDGTGMLTVAARGAERGLGTSEVQISLSVDGDAPLETIGINGPYLRQELMALEGIDVVLKIRGPLLPMLLLDPTLDTWRGVVMPIHLAGE